MGLTIVSFSAMAVAARELSAHMSTFQILSFRSIVGLLILVPLTARLGGWRTSRPLLHLSRNVMHFAGQYGWTFGVAVLPLAEVFALEFTVPIWVAVLAIVFLRERLSLSRAVTVGAGFVGTLVILRPGIAIVDPASLVVLGAALCYAGAGAMVKVLTRTDAPITILFYMTVMQLPMALVPAIGDWSTPVPADLPWIVLVGVSALGAHYGMARALRLADATVVFPVDFLRLPAIAVLALVVYGEAVEVWTLVGAAMIFAANYWNVRREARAG